MLNSTANQEVPAITSMDKAFVATGMVQEKKFAEFLVARIQRQAEKFTGLNIKGSEQPVVIPE